MWDSPLITGYKYTSVHSIANNNSLIFPQISWFTHCIYDVLIFTLMAHTHMKWGLLTLNILKHGFLSSVEAEINSFCQIRQPFSFSAFYVHPLNF